MRRALLLAAVLLAASVAVAAPPRVDSIAIVVEDLDRALDFYTRVLPFEKVGETEIAGEGWERLEGVFALRARVARLRLGEERVDLVDFLAPEGRPIPVDSRSDDRWFQHVAIVVSDMERAYRHLRAHGVRHASSGPQRLPDWNPNAGGIEAFYFKDPDGHVLEILRFPEGKGDPRWHRPTDRLFLGIDHTAIVVDDTERSLRFWRDALGLRVAGESENWGTEQEHLNHVFGARLRITALRGTAGPGVEFLEYLAPDRGRPYPVDTTGADLWSWRIRVTAADPAEAAAAAKGAGGAWVSPGKIEVGGEWGLREGAQVRDPDGHAVVLAPDGDGR